VVQLLFNLLKNALIFDISTDREARARTPAWGGKRKTGFNVTGKYRPRLV
jgi:hypothetical protein